MIVSHKYKYIFIKPGKVGGTSVLAALSESTGQADIVTNFARYSTEEGILHTITQDLEMSAFVDCPRDDLQRQVVEALQAQLDAECPGLKIVSAIECTDEAVTALASAGVATPGLTSTRWLLDLDMPVEVAERKANAFARNNSKFHQHMEPAEIREQVGDDVWEKYCKITIVRNPWDEVVSAYCWNNAYGNSLVPTEEGFKEAFRKKIKDHVETPPNNNVYYFDDGEPVANYYMRFERLERDYQDITRQLEIPPVVLPVLRRLNDEHRHHGRFPYYDFYDEECREIVGHAYKDLIELFGYEFGKYGGSKRFLQPCFHWSPSYVIENFGKK